MVEGTVWLSNGLVETLYAVDMLSALKLATAMYAGQVRRMEFRTLEVQQDGRETNVHAENY